MTASIYEIIYFQENFRTSFDTEITELPEADQVIKNQNANIKSQLKESIQNKMLQENSGIFYNFNSQVMRPRISCLHNNRGQLKNPDVFGALYTLRI